MLLNSLALPRLAARWSVRRLLGGAYLVAGAVVALAGLATGADAAIAAAGLVAAALFVTVIDGLGPLPFLRAVHVHERAQMTAVHRSYIDISALVTPLAFFVLLSAGGFLLAFAVQGVALAAIGLTVLRYLPARLWNGRPNEAVASARLTA